MVGDRSHDIEGAAGFGIPTIHVEGAMRSTARPGPRRGVCVRSSNSVPFSECDAHHYGPVTPDNLFS